MKEIFQIFFLIPLLNCQSIDPNEFCKNIEEECSKIHSFCNPPNRTDFELISLNPIMKKYILKLVNDIRNSVASGKLTNFEGKKIPSAARMPALIWDIELQWLAEALSRNCPSKMNQEDLKCQFTPNHKRLFSAIVNQTLIVDKNESSIYNSLEQLIKEWEDQSRNTPISSIYYYPNQDMKNIEMERKKEKEFLENIKKSFRNKSEEFNYPIQQYKNETDFEADITNNKEFAQIIKDSSSKIGCAVYFCGVSEVIISRNFSILCIFDGMIVDKLYQTSEVCGMDCGQLSKKYSCLCWNHPVSEPGTFHPKVIRIKGVRRCGSELAVICRPLMVFIIFAIYLVF